MVANLYFTLNLTTLALMTLLVGSVAYGFYLTNDIDKKVVAGKFAVGFSIALTGIYWFQVYLAWDNPDVAGSRLGAFGDLAFALIFTLTIGIIGMDTRIKVQPGDKPSFLRTAFMVWFGASVISVFAFATAIVGDPLSLLWLMGIFLFTWGVAVFTPPVQRDGFIGMALAAGVFLIVVFWDGNLFTWSVGFVLALLPATAGAGVLYFSRQNPVKSG